MTMLSPLPSARTPPTLQTDRVLTGTRSQSDTLGAHIEVFVERGNPLGGPTDLKGEAHLDWLRSAYKSDASVKATLDQLAGLAAFSRNRIAVLSRTPDLAEHVAHAIRGLASRLSPLQKEDLS